jgi:hypothetical protein
MMSNDGEAQRALWLAIRQALLIMLGAVETYLGMDRSIIPKHERK